ncbi:MAG TPA: TMEM175 family protein [Chthoniobacterales bacterium]|nr:TMEM175 family protein [Chthoniobacterales bacterium]
MESNRVEAFSDGVFAIIITIMVLELKVPHGSDWAALQPVVPIFFNYVLSFVYLGIYWNNHHHLLKACGRVTGGVLWANLHLLFWLSLFPFVTAWLGENYASPARTFAAVPSALYGAVLLLASIAYLILQTTLINAQAEGCESQLALALGNDWKGKLSPILYAIAIASSFIHPWIAGGIYVLVALIWLVPDRRIERALLADR